MALHISKKESEERKTDLITLKGSFIDNEAKHEEMKFQAGETIKQLILFNIN